jgi:SAM-dependent methyltransferase
MSEVTPDGSPVAVWLALPAGDEPSLIDAAIPAASRILELGCGVGRVTRVLLAFGHEVTAVDESPAMLAHVTGARTVHAPIAGLRLGERFGVVLAASHLLNDADPVTRAELLATCAAHVEPGGLVLGQRHYPDWTADPRPSRGRSGPVEIDVEIAEPPVDGVFAAVVRYRVGRRTWAQPFRAIHLTDERLEQEAGAAGLRLAGWADEERVWAVLRPVRPAASAG